MQATDTHTVRAQEQGSQIGSPQPWRLRQTRDGRSRSLAWVFYALLSSLGAIVLLSQPG